MTMHKPKPTYIENPNLLLRYFRKNGAPILSIKIRNGSFWHEKTRTHKNKSPELRFTFFRCANFYLIWFWWFEIMIRLPFNKNWFWNKKSQMWVNR